MYSTSVYFYIPRQIVVLNIGNSPRRYHTVYAKNLKLHKGVDNRIQFQFLNQEQKPVDITGKEITIRILNSAGTEVLIQRALTPLLPVTGITEFQLFSSELDSIIAQKATYTIEIPVDSFNLPVFANGDGGARGVIEIIDDILPKHMPSMDISVATHSEPNSDTVLYYSDVVSTSYSPNLTIQTWLSDYSGSISIQGAPTPNSDWYDIIQSSTYTAESESQYFTIDGFHPYIRLLFTSTQGNVDKILAR